jgi:hypothetical protein
MSSDLPDPESLRLLYNNTPVHDFCDLTPNEIHHLLYDPFGEKSPLILQNDIRDEALDTAPFFRLVEELLKIIQRVEFVKLTPLGALPRKVLHELYLHNFITEDIIEAGISKLQREDDSLAIRCAHVNAHIAKLVRETKGKLVLSKLGKELINPAKRRELFKTVLSTYMSTFNWGFNDGYTKFPVGQLGSGYTLYLISKFGGKERTIDFYTGMYLHAFPRMIDHFADSGNRIPLDQFITCYSTRTFTRFMEWFGLVRVRKENKYSRIHEAIVLRNDTFETIFRFE